jgi:hypothetical protein
MGTTVCDGTAGTKTCGNYDSDSCTEWKSTNCPNVDYCENGKCITPPPADPDPTCTASRTCLSDTEYKKVLSDCTEKTYPCASGTKCDNGGCVAMLTTPDPVIPEIPIADACKDVTCPDGCSNGGFQTQGKCEQETGQCVYDKVEIGVVECMGKADPTTFKDYFDKYGVYALGGLLVLLIIYYIGLSVGGKKK